MFMSWKRFARRREGAKDTEERDDHHDSNGTNPPSSLRPCASAGNAPLYRPIPHPTAASLRHELQGSLLSHRWNRRVEIGSSSRRDATVRTRRFAALLGPTTICQMDRSDPIAPSREQTAARCGKAAARPEWEAMVKATEGILGKEWSEMILRHGDWGRDGLLAVATRHLGWRLGEVVEREPGVSYAAAAQGIRRFWKRAPNSPEMQAFVTTLLD